METALPGAAPFDKGNNFLLKSKHSIWNFYKNKWSPISRISIGL